MSGALVTAASGNATVAEEKDKKGRFGTGQNCSGRAELQGRSAAICQGQAAVFPIACQFAKRLH